MKDNGKEKKDEKAPFGSFAFNFRIMRYMHKS